jgi:hypothetical protein
MEKNDDYRCSYDWTTDRATYNKIRKRYLNNTGQIHCDRCSYHKGENSTNKWYSTANNARHPNWKLVTKNRKQWMKKPYDDHNGFVTWSGWLGDLNPEYTNLKK